MARCAGFKPDGSPCERIVGMSQKYCYAHDPRHQEARSWAASKAARSKPSRELRTLKEQARKLYEEVHAGEVEPKAGAVLTQVTNTQARILELERRLKETEEFEGRLKALEAELEHRGRGRTWGGT